MSLTVAKSVHVVAGRIDLYASSSRDLVPVARPRYGPSEKALEVSLVVSHSLPWHVVQRH